MSINLGLVPGLTILEPGDFILPTPFDEGAVPIEHPDAKNLPRRELLVGVNAVNSVVRVSLLTPDHNATEPMQLQNYLTSFTTKDRRALTEPGPHELTFNRKGLNWSTEDGILTMSRHIGTLLRFAELVGTYGYGIPRLSPEASLQIRNVGVQS